MIVKVVARDESVSIWDKEGNRLYFSEEKKDIDFGKNLIAQYKTQYYGATWKNKIVGIKKPVRGYSW